MSELFKSVNEADAALKKWSDEELAFTYLDLDENFTLMELTEKIELIKDRIKQVDNFIQGDATIYFLIKLKND